MQDEKRYYKKLIDSIKLLSLDFNEQKEFFPEYSDVPFEILDTFEKAFMQLPQLLELNKIEIQVLPNILRLHNSIGLELNKIDFETMDVKKLCNSKEWMNLREISKATLKQMNEPVEKPDIKNI